VRILPVGKISRDAMRPWQRDLERHARLGGWSMKEVRPPPLFPAPDGEQSDHANDIQDKDNNRVDAKVKELAFGAED
jgi:hypothetical protein